MFNYSYLNTQVCGNLGRDCKVISKSDAAMKVASVAVAVTDSRRGRDGEVAETTTWVNVKFFGKTAERAEKLLKKGDMILATGTPEVQTYKAKDGSSAFALAVNANDFVLLSRGKGAASKESAAKPKAESYAKAYEDERQAFDAVDDIP